MGHFHVLSILFFNNYLNMEGYQTIAISVLVSMPWSFKTFFGIVSDSFPIFGYRRRPYMILGWTVCAILLCVLALLPVEDPYFIDPSYYSATPEELEQNPDWINEDAPDSGGKYTILMMFAACGYLFAAVASDGMVVELAQREPEAQRGKTQTTIYLMRTIAVTGSTALIAFCMNGEEYGGEFSWTLQFNEIMWLLMIPCIIVIPITWFFIEEEKVEGVSFSKQMIEMYNIVQHRAIWQIVLFQFLNALFWGFTATPINPISRLWAGVKPLNEGIFSVLGNTIFIITLFMVKKVGLHWSWRRTIAITTVAVVLLDSIVSFFTIYDVIRNEWFFLGVPLLQELPYAINFIVGTFVVVEVASEGHEAATYGLLTTVHNMAYPVASTFTNIVNRNFDVTQADIRSDTDYVRNEVAYCFLIMYAMKLLSLVWLFLLPDQKPQAQALRKNGGKQPLIGNLVMLCAAFFLVWSVLINIFAIFPSTSCLIIAGGSGC